MIHENDEIAQGLKVLCNTVINNLPCAVIQTNGKLSEEKHDYLHRLNWFYDEKSGGYIHYYTSWGWIKIANKKSTKTKPSNIKYKQNNTLEKNKLRRIMKNQNITLAEAQKFWSDSKIKKNDDGNKRK